MNRRGFLKFLPGVGAAIGALGAAVPALGVLGGRVAPVKPKLNTLTLYRGGSNIPVRRIENWQAEYNKMRSEQLVYLSGEQWTAAEQARMTQR